MQGTAHKIHTLAAKAGIPTKEFFLLQKAFYISDSSSYKYVRESFMISDASGELKFKPTSGLVPSRVELLEAEVMSEEVEFGEKIQACFSPNIEEGKPLERVISLFNIEGTFGGHTDIFKLAHHIKDNISSIENMEGVQDDALNADELSAILEMADYVITLEADGYAADHAALSVKHRLLCQQSGISASVEGKTWESLEENDRGVMKGCDEAFFQNLAASLRPGEAPDKMSGFVNKLRQFIHEFYQTKAEHCQPFKLLSAMSRNSPSENYVWTQTPEAAHGSLAKHLTKCGLSLDQGREVFAALQAYSHEILKHITFPGKNDDGTIDILRTEGSSVMESYSLQPGATLDSAKKMSHSALDCASIGKAVICYGSELTHYRIPLHRVVGGCFLNPSNRPGSPKLPPFGDAGFNGITFQAEGLGFSYPGRALTSTEIGVGVLLGTGEKPGTGEEFEIVGRVAPDPGDQESQKLENTFGLQILEIRRKSTGEMERRYVATKDMPSEYTT